MADSLNQYQMTPADWRKTLRQNNFRTRIVIIMFFLIYFGLGMLVDLYLQATHYPRASLSDLFHALITFQLFPIATCVMLAIAAISLFVTYSMYDRLMLMGTEYHEITATNAANVQEKQLYNVIEEITLAAGLRYIPKVYIIDADYMNAFASGYSEKSAMVAITRGLMQKLNRDELQAVMAHEISHIRHLDIKLTLTASLLANLSIMALDMLFYSAMFSGRGNSEENGRSRNNLAIVIMILRYTLPLITAILLLYLSRTRELMADAGCVELTRNNEPLARALIKISTDYSANKNAYSEQLANTPNENVRREAYIFDPTQAGISSISSLSDVFSTHPSLETRLAALGFKTKASRQD